MVQAATKAGRSLARDFGEVENLQVSLKGPGDFVSAADRRADGIIIEALGKARPGYGFLTEESGTIAGSDGTHRWIVDPLDGTTNFLHGIPIFAISIALEREGELVAGVIYNPAMNELFAAERGSGAYFNDRRMRVSARRDPATAVIASGSASIGTPSRVRFPVEAAAALREVAGVRETGSAAIDLAWLGAGRLDGYWQHGLSPWDVAAGMVIVREAGGLVTGAGGRDDVFQTGTVVAGAAPIHARLLALLAAARTPA